MTVIRLLTADRRLQFDCNGRIAPPATPKLLGLSLRVTYSTRVHLDSRGEDSSTIFTRTRVAPERPDPLSVFKQMGQI